MWGVVVRGEGGDSSTTYLLSATHWRDFFAIHMLTGPFSGFLLVPAAIHRLMTGRILDARVGFLLGCALPPFAASWLFGDPLQGFPRDWDLFAPFALASCAAGLACMVWEPLEALAARRLLTTIIAVSLFHTGSWVGINASFGRSFARYQTLPISRGRTEMVVGFWYLNHSRTQEARAWFQRSVAAYPLNNAAQHQLGLFAMDEGRYAEAVTRFRVATLARPDKSNYRLSLVDALVLVGRPGEALSELDVLVSQEPGRAELHACRGIVLVGLGRAVEARAALERASALAPTEPRYGRLIARLDDPQFYPRVLLEDWDWLVLK
jgi:tetratricopeptide (TPR) repeat protein